MSGVQEPAPIAIAVSDLHLSHRPPLWRSVEKDWYAAMERPLTELRQLAIAHSCPVICGGDVFDRWNPPPELINFAITHLPQMYAVPGQHDLPHHNYKDIKKSGYWTLVEAGIVIDLVPGESRQMASKSNIRLHGFPWGTPATPVPETYNDRAAHIAVVHAYIWSGENKYEGAPEEKNRRAYADALRGYQWAIFGDNHKGFAACSNYDTHIINCGGFMRRKSDEIDYRPSVWLLYADAPVKRHRLNISEDKYIEKLEGDGLENPFVHIGDFVQQLNELGATRGDFPGAVRRWLDANDPGEEVRRHLLNVLDQCTDGPA